jgi:hypothetical protein
MKVVNTDREPVYACGFVGTNFSDERRLIFYDESEIVLGPNLPRLGLQPYGLPGMLIVRGLGHVQLDCGDTSPFVMLDRGKVAVYQRPFGSANRFGIKEGVVVSHFKETHLIDQFIELIQSVNRRPSR